MKFAVTLGVMVALFGVCSARIGPEDIERYGYGIFRQLCNFDVTKDLVLNREDFYEDAGIAATDETATLKGKGKALETSLIGKNKGLGADGANPLPTGMNTADFALMYKLLFKEVDGLKRVVTPDGIAEGTKYTKEGIANTDKKVTVDEFILYLSIVDISKDLTEVRAQFNSKTPIPPRNLAYLLARFIAAIADDTGDSHMDASEFTGAVLGDGALPYTASVVMFRFMDFEKDNGDVKGISDFHSLVHTKVLVRWLVGGTKTFAEGVELAFFMPITA